MNATMEPQVRESRSLYFREGTSDKVYIPSIIERPDGTFDVIASYGRRGATLMHTQKASGVDEAAARKVYAKLVAEKEAKGYAADADADAPDPVDLPPETPGPPTEGRKANVPVQLLNPISPAEADRYLLHDDWVVQEKKDGVRRLLVIRHGNVTGVNRRGLFVSVSRAIKTESSIFGTDAIVDGEQIGDDFFAFDLLRVEGRDLVGIAFEHRYAVLEAAFAGLDLKRLHLVPRVACDDRAPYIARLRESGAEGAVLRNRWAPLQIGRPATGGCALKLKFWASATVVVTAQNEQDSVAIAVQGPNGLVPIGNVSTNVGQKPAVGTLIEVKYLYAHRGGSLVQPSFKGLRDDVVGPDSIDSLSYKGEAAS